jgi:hypothetical protein
MAREWEIVEKMVQLYCEREHHQGGLCVECQQLLKVYRIRQQSCRHGLSKPICAHCSYSCFGHYNREKVMAAIGAARPQMVWRHPQLSLRYWLDGFYQPPAPASSRADYASWGGE